MQQDPRSSVNLEQERGEPSDESLPFDLSRRGRGRLVLFADAGQVQDTGQNFAMNQFKTSTGAEIRFFMPVLNVPFRLIFAANPNRSGVLDNSWQPQKAFTFRFAVGSTF